jgi:hypothetical protein
LVCSPTWALINSSIAIHRQWRVGSKRKHNRVASTFIGPPEGAGTIACDAVAMVLRQETTVP